MNKKVLKLLISIFSITIIIFSILIFNELKYKFKYIKTTAEIVEIKNNGITNTYLSYKINNKIINVEKNKYKLTNKKITIYYDPNNIFEYYIKKNMSLHYAIITISLISIIILIILLTKKNKKKLYFYKFKK